MLRKERMEGISQDILNVAALQNPVGSVLAQKTLDNGLDISKVRVPMGVIGIIYEARPNVSFDVFSLCFKTQNACILKGGSDAAYSNKAIVTLIQEVLVKHNIDPNIVALLPTDRQATTEMLQATAYVDIIIPRGSQGLINYVRDNAKVPVIETGAGIVHTYVDASADTEKAASIVCNAKTRRVSVCNALDCLLIHKDKLAALTQITDTLIAKETQVYADKDAYKILEGNYPADLLEVAETSHFGTEFLSNKMAIKTVIVFQSLTHIAVHSSKHRKPLLLRTCVVEKYLNEVDAAAVYANTSTAFDDSLDSVLKLESAHKSYMQEDRWL